MERSRVRIKIILKTLYICFEVLIYVSKQKQMAPVFSEESSFHLVFKAGQTFTYISYDHLTSHGRAEGSSKCVTLLTGGAMER